MDPDVSVIVPVHNASRFLPPALTNLAKLEGRDSIEFLLIDDHSTDDTWEVLHQLAEQLLPEARIMRSPGRGVAAARNAAAREARGTFVWFADCDDTWEPQIVQLLLACARENEADVAVANAVKVSDDAPDLVIEDAPTSESLSGDQALSRLLRGGIQGHLWNKLIRRSLLSEEVFPSTRAHSDLGGLLRVLPRAHRVSLLPETLYTYFVHAGSILNQKAYRWEDLEECLTIAERSSSAVNPSHRRSLLLFKYREVVVPLENETLRREAWESAAVLRGVRRRNRRRVRFAEVVELVRAGEQRTAAQTLALRYTPRVYRALYQRHRQRAWAQLDEVEEGFSDA